MAAFGVKHFYMNFIVFPRTRLNFKACSRVFRWAECPADLCEAVESSMTLIGRIGVGTVVGAAAVCALSTAASAQVRTFGPAAPYLVTGRSVSVPPYHQADQQSFEESGQKDRMRGGDDRTDPAGGDQSAPR
jgi:hypothetical protein